MVFQPPQEMSKVSALEAVSIEEVNGSFGTGNDTKRQRGSRQWDRNRRWAANRHGHAALGYTS